MIQVIQVLKVIELQVLQVLQARLAHLRPVFRVIYSPSSLFTHVKKLLLLKTIPRLDKSKYSHSRHLKARLKYLKEVTLVVDVLPS